MQGGLLQAPPQVGEDELGDAPGQVENGGGEGREAAAEGALSGSPPAPFTPLTQQLPDVSILILFLLPPTNHPLSEPPRSHNPFS